MKNVIISFSVVITFLASCSPSAEKKVNRTDSAEAKKTDTAAVPTPVKKTISNPELPGDFSALVPIDVLNSKSTNVYEKYGIEFSGNCYSCDLAGLSVTKNKMVWTNVCDEKDIFEITDFSFFNEGNKTILKTPERIYILTPIDKAPVYELVVEGRKLELNNKRVSRYFTTQKAMPLFKEHDCGDFEG
ncbi:hypothetical protein [Chryseobacterium indologenes]|uniref:Uncharacterized protein n=1 Tax=Chryseobacterium indologenes TaxID=253 RepID=A0A0N0ZV18_CHRID|nr:hypothetical protein [Chryseobacterium indologenes]KPE49617.1 hypothetical protein AOB46_19040 [Chryseobacterium indologenes]